MFQHYHARFGVLGIPIDDLNLEEVTLEIDAAVGERRRMMIATVNTNFLVSSHVNAEFRTTLGDADLCTVDGIGVLLVCRLLSAPVGCRVSGADILEHLFSRSETGIGRPLRVFFFGGAPGVAAAAQRKVNEAQSPAITCVGALYPGFGSVEDLSSPESIAAINAASPDILLVALGAEKGQAWLARNSAALDVPVCSHFGAAIGFLGGSIRRAPKSWQSLGFEWLWRIWQEPGLASRYWRDGCVLTQLLFSRILPQIAAGHLRRLGAQRPPLSASSEEDDAGITLRLSGTAFGSSPSSVHAFFAPVRAARVPVRLDVEKLDMANVCVMGEIMRLRHDLSLSGGQLTVSGASAGVAWSLGFAAEGAR